MTFQIIEPVSFIENIW